MKGVPVGARIVDVSTMRGIESRSGKFEARGKSVTGDADERLTLRINRIVPSRKFNMIGTFEDLHNVVQAIVL